MVLIYMLEGRQQPASQGLHCSPHFISSHRHFIISHHHKKKGEYSTIRYFERQRDHIHITFITVYYYSCSILLLAIVVNLLLSLIYKLNFIIGMYVQEKNIVYIQGSVLPVVSGITGGLGMYPPQIRAGRYVMKTMSFLIYHLYQKQGQ